MARNTVSIKINIEKIIFIAFDMNIFILFRLIQSEEKNFTSSIFLAFITIKPIKPPHIISAIIAITHKNQNNLDREVSDFTFFVTFLFFNAILKSIFSQKLDGTVFAIVEYDLSFIWILDFHYLFILVSSTFSWDNALAFNSIWV